MRLEAAEAAARTRRVSRIHLQPRIDERADEPAPHGALVIRRVARAQIAVVLRLVVTMTGRQRTKSNGREQAIADHVETGRQRSPSSTG